MLNIFNPENHTDESLKLRIKLRKKQIYKIKQELGLIKEPKPDYIVFAKENNLTQFANTLQNEFNNYKNKKL